MKKRTVRSEEAGIENGEEINNNKKQPNRRQAAAAQARVKSNL